MYRKSYGRKERYTHPPPPPPLPGSQEPNNEASAPSCTEQSKLAVYDALLHDIDIQALSSKLAPKGNASGSTGMMGTDAWLAR